MPHEKKEDPAIVHEVSTSFVPGNAVRLGEDVPSEWIRLKCKSDYILNGLTYQKGFTYMGPSSLLDHSSAFERAPKVKLRPEELEEPLFRSYLPATPKRKK